MAYCKHEEREDNLCNKLMLLKFELFAINAI